MDRKKLVEQFKTELRQVIKNCEEGKADEEIFRTNDFICISVAFFDFLHKSKYTTGCVA